MADNGTIGHVQTLMCPKPGPVIPPGTPEMRAIDPVAEQAAKANRERTANTLGIALLGPVFGGPAAAARVMGAPEAVVGKMGEFGLDMAGAVALRGAGGRGRVSEPMLGREVATAPKVPAKPGAAGGAAAGSNGVFVAKKYSLLDWNAVVPKKGKYKGESRTDHVRRHNVNDLSKDNHGVFSGDGVDVTNKAWERAQDLGMSPNASGELVVPMGQTVGVSGGALGTGAPLTSVRIIVTPGTTNIVTAMPF